MTETKKRGRREPSRERPQVAPPAPEWPSAGLCADAQADGVPCSEPGRLCEQCDRGPKQRA